MSDSKKEKNELRRLATAARRRMKAGYWTEYKREREQNSAAAEILGKDPIAADTALRNRYARGRNAAENTVCNHEESFYRRVCDILDRDRDVTNPVNLLLDPQKLQSLDESARQRYVISVMSKYCEMRERYDLEHRA
jgi:hypothetical protein